MRLTIGVGVRFPNALAIQRPYYIGKDTCLGGTFLANLQVFFDFTPFLWRQVQVAHKIHNHGIKGIAVHR